MCTAYNRISQKFLQLINEVAEEVCALFITLYINDDLLTQVDFSYAMLGKD